MEILSTQNLKFQYFGSSDFALDDITMSVSNGDILLICGDSGSGKSTLLKLIKHISAPNGQLKGEILFNGKNISDILQRVLSKDIGYICQSPDEQLVTNKVWHELAFGLENMGVDKDIIRSRVAETASFFGIQQWFDKDVDQLSDGQKQILNLASVSVMRPKLLLMDEPLSRLDPMSAQKLIDFIVKLNSELGITVIITEHNIEGLLHVCSKLAVLEDGRLLSCDSAQNVILKYSEHVHSLPAGVKVWNVLEKNKNKCPLTFNECRDWLYNYSKEHEHTDIEPEIENIYAAPSVILKSVSFRYEKNADDVLSNIFLKMYPGEIAAVVGPNGVGKTTLMSLIAGFNKPYSGEIKINGRIAVLPQDPKSLFIKDTILSNFKEILRNSNIADEGMIDETVTLCKLESCLSRDLYELSGGEQQRAALAVVLLTHPDILVLDEPTKGMDSMFKHTLVKILKSLAKQGVTVILVSHDLEFCAECASKCIFLFNGEVTCIGNTREFFAENAYYTTYASRMSKDVIKNAITSYDIISAFDENYNYDKEEVKYSPEYKQSSASVSKENIKARPKLSLLIGALLLITGIFVALSRNLLFTNIKQRSIVSAILIAVSCFYFLFSVDKHEPYFISKKKFSFQNILSFIILIVCVPITVYIGSTYFESNKYLFISFLVIFECLISFFISFEINKNKPRKLVIIAIMSALAVAGRCAFFMIPQFKPVAAIVIISGITLGSQSGFAVGAISMLVSNFMFSQGPWTVWQMFAMGLVGFVAGTMGNIGVFKKTVPLSLFGFFSVLVLYGGIMNFSSAVFSRVKISLLSVLPFYLSGLSVDIVHAASTFIFLFVLSSPLIKIIDYTKNKYLI